MEAGRKILISFEEAESKVKSELVFLGSEQVSLAESLHRVLAEDLFSRVEMPPFDKSAMDGFACRRADLGSPMQLVGEIPAGATPQRELNQGECMRIMTGAMLPPGADMVLIQEESNLQGNGFVLATSTGSGNNICYKGEDCRIGDLLLRKGVRIRPQHIAVLAANGITAVPVGKKPRITIASTGNELVEPWEEPSLSQIRNSNGIQLLTQLAEIGIQANYKGIIHDEFQSVERLLTESIQSSQLVILSGGVSVGDYDFIPQVLTKLGARIIFHGMNTKPGKHLLFAKVGNTWIFGLPGNPVSSFVQFELMVKPFILQLMGQTPSSAGLKLTLADDWKRKKAENRAFIPIAINPQGLVIPLEYHGSAHIHAYQHATGIMEIAPDITKIEKGETVYVRPL